MKLRKPIYILLALAVYWFAACESVKAQQSSTEAQIVKADGNAGELNSLYLDVLTNEQRSTNELVFVIARLGRGETARSLSLNRLRSAHLYLVESGRIKREQVILAEGELIAGEGRVEFYLGGRLILVSLAERGRNVSLMCCEGYIPPRKKRSRRMRG